jgi:alpha-1,2-mannosyltransferase
VTAVAPTRLGRRRTYSTALLVGIAGMFLVTLVASAGTGRLAADFHVSYLDAAQAVRAGDSPYTSDHELPYVYPPVLAELLVPFTFVPEDVASFLASLGSFAAVMGAVALVGVRDVRCYAVVVIWAPGWNSFEMANISAVLTLLAALVWRYRDCRWSAATALGGALSVKLFLWPLLVWAAATRRVSTAVLALAIGLVGALVSWAVIGFDGLGSYPDQLREVEFEESYSFVGMAAELGLDPLVGRIAMAIAGGALLVAVGYLGQRGEEARAFICALVAALVLTPVVWLHYLVLLAVPLGIARPRFAPIWLLPIVLWVCPRDDNGDGLQPFMPAVVAAIVLATLVWRPWARASTMDAYGQ